ncbi:cytochrome c-type biogenesis protein [Algibacillus agarilyticus]|uniref:cytochrome c-type biogenesis protein n=1 Tax=Algibacillus agarilyticus TaxID=2234133 RepID=UPI000DD057FD|nr:cytochrome c-type biogenesis protein [Algibacillus agarilyticus]
MKILLSLIISLVITASSAASPKDKYPFETIEEQRLFNQLTKALRCPKCQNQNIADSNAGVAVDLKNKTYQLVKEGKSEQYVIDFMVQRYGNFVTYQPPINSVTVWLWLIPLLIAFMLGFIVYKRSQSAHQSASQTDIEQEMLEKAKAILKQGK